MVLLRTPQGEFTATYGTTMLGTASPPSADTHFRIASNTKTMTAAVVMLLAQEGKLSLDDPVSKYVPDVPNGDTITIAELLEMRSGLYNYTDAPEVSASLDRDPTEVWSCSRSAGHCVRAPPNFPPGTAYEYNNTNYALLGLVAEKVDGKPLAQVMQDRLFGPLGMQHTLLPASTVNTIPDPHAHGYLYGSSSVALSDASPYSPEVQAAARAGTLLPNDYTRPEPFLCRGSRGRHLHRQRSRHLDPGTGRRPRAQRRISAPLARRLAATRTRASPTDRQYGYGISQLRWGPNALYFHGGETPGYNSKICYDPANQMTLVVWTNMAVSVDEQQTANTLMVKVLDQIYELSPLSPPPPRG